MPKRDARNDPEFYRRAFREFVRNELACGGPDPHLRLAQKLAEWKTDSVIERAWFIGCYIGPYNVPTAEALFHYWSRPQAVLENPEHFGRWIRENWHGLVLRRERRPVRSPAKLAEHLVDYASWLTRSGGFSSLASSKTFDDSFKIVRQVRYNGRYATMKLYEALRRTVGLPRHEFTDIRPAGGWSPRLMLSWLFPQYAEALNGNDSEINCITAQNLAAGLKLALARDDGIELDWFNLEVMLCDTKQACDGKQYPGRAHDSELGHLYKVRNAFPDVPFLTLEARRELFPGWALGEVQGWDGRREECSEVLNKYGYTWTDSLYNFVATKAIGDFSHPIQWESPYIESI